MRRLPRFSVTSSDNRNCLTGICPIRKLYEGFKGANGSRIKIALELTAYANSGGETTPIVLGWIGFDQYYGYGTYSQIEYFYRTLTLFAFGSGSLSSPPPRTLQIARFLAPSAASVIAQSIMTLQKKYYDDMRLRHWQNHVVVCGLGPGVSRLPGIMPPAKRTWSFSNGMRQIRSFRFLRRSPLHCPIWRCHTASDAGTGRS